MSTKIEICNNVLSRFGQVPNVENIDNPRNEEERVFARFYDKVCKKAILKYKPSCCERRLLLSQDPTYVPTWGYTSGYKYPNTILQVLEVEGDKWEHEKYPVENGYILTDIPLGTIDAPADPLKVRVLAYLNATEFDEAFCDLLEMELAKVVIYSLIKDAQERANIMAILKIDSYDFANKESDESGVEVINGSNLFGISWSNRK